MNSQCKSMAVAAQRRVRWMDLWRANCTTPAVFRRTIGHFLLALLGSLAALTSAGFGQGSAPSAPFIGWLKYYPYLSDTSRYRLPTTGGTAFNGKFLRYIATGPSLADTTGWTTVSLTTDVIGTLPVANGGTGTTTLTDGGILLGSGMGAVTPMSVLGNGALVVGDGTTDPTTLSMGTTLQQLRVNSGATGLEWATISGSGTTDSIAVDTDGNGTIDKYLYSATGAIAMLKKGSNITLTVSSDTLTIAGPAGSGTADSLAIDTDGNGTIDAYLYSTAGAMAMLREGTGMTFTVDTDTLKIDATLGTDIATGELQATVPIWSGFFSTFAGGPVGANNPVFCKPGGGIYTRGNTAANPDTIELQVNFDNTTIDTTAGGILEVKALGIGNAQLAGSAVTAAKVSSNTLTAAEIAIDAITSSELAASAVGSDEIANASIASVDIGSGAVDSVALGASSVLAAEIATDAVDALELKAASKLIGKFYMSSTKGDSTVADSAGATMGYVNRQIDNAGNETRYIGSWYAYGTLVPPTDSITLSLPFRSGNIHYLFSDSTNQGNDTDRVDCAISVPTDFDLDSLSLAYITSSATSANSNVDSVEIWGPDYSNGTNACDSLWHTENVDYAATSLTKVAFAVDEPTIIAGNKFAVRFKCVLNVDNAFIRISWVDFVGKER